MENKNIMDTSLWLRLPSGAGMTTTKITQQLVQALVAMKMVVANLILYK